MEFPYYIFDELIKLPKPAKPNISPAIGRGTFFNNFVIFPPTL